MAEYINLEDAIKKVAEIIYDEPPHLPSVELYKEYVAKELADISSINVVEQEASVWIKTADTMTCYKCGAVFKRRHEDDLTSLDDFAKFCPCCGSLMVGESL